MIKEAIIIRKTLKSYVFFKMHALLLVEAQIKVIFIQKEKKVIFGIFFLSSVFCNLAVTEFP